MIVVFETVHKYVVGSNAMTIVFSLEWLDDGGITVAVEGEHGVLVSTARAHKETAHVVGVEFADWLNPEVQYVGLELGEGDGKMW